MTNTVKKNDYLLPFARLFTRIDGDAYDSIPFQSSESVGDESFPVLASPTTWSAESVAIMADAAHPAVPADLRANEENTVPSWLWRHQSRSARREAEADLRDIFNRAVGSAAAKAWKLGLFSCEKHARAFYDETRFALMQRHIAIAPEVLAPWGLDWAYGGEEAKAPLPPLGGRGVGVRGGGGMLSNSPLTPVSNTGQALTLSPQGGGEGIPSGLEIPLSNATIDSLIGTPSPSPLWKKLFTLRSKKAQTISLRLCDIATDWHSPSPRPARAAIDVLALRHTDGGIHIDALRQTARLLTILLDLQERRDVTIGLANLAPLLLAFGLAYDSDAGRAMAASLAALVTAECTATSAELSALRGISAEFSENHDAALRALRNHRRAVYGDGNDYEKLSVLPTPLPLNNCPDLSLVAEAQRRWDEALDMARAFGLRAVQTTDLTPNPVLAVLMSSAAQGLEPMQSLTAMQDAPDVPRAVLHPAVCEALARLDYPRDAVAATMRHIVGAGSLRKAHGINAASLRARGITDAALEKIESYLPCVNTIRLAVTPWIVGVDFCRTQLGIPARVLESPRFDLLKHLGFSDADIKAADLYCYGHGTAHNAKSLHLRHRPLFACGNEISSQARLRMSASVQSFISGDTGLIVRLPTQQSIERGAETTLSAWRSGLKSLTIIFDPAIAAKPQRQATARRIKAAGQPQAKGIAAPQHRPMEKTPPVFVAQTPIGAKRGARR
ncbi:MAG: hypothetical protein P4M13_02260 [Alphaproteobacteria bacterium]|nr:hypothetical protein [Alphaproteobacteria bacterium]